MMPHTTKGNKSLGHEQHLKYARHTQLGYPQACILEGGNNSIRRVHKHCNRIEQVIH